MILEVGCGLYPKDEFFHIDINRDSKHIDLCCSVLYLPFKSNSFNYIYCSNVLEHLINPHRAIREISRVGKKAIIKVPNKEFYYWKTSDSNNEHLYSWTKYTLKNLLKLHFKKVRVQGSTRQLSRVNKKYALFLSIIKALFARFNELTAICEN